jgi:hypothetical protein
MTSQIAHNTTSSTGILATVSLMLENKTVVLQKKQYVHATLPQKIPTKVVNRPQFNIQQPRKITN